VANKGENILGEEKSNDFKQKKEGGGKGRGVADLWEGTFEELNATVDTIVWFPELRTKSQYTQEIASLYRELTIQGRLTELFSSLSLSS
jgi:hypothetical protein